MYRHVLCVYPYPHTPRSITSFPPLGLEYIAAALEPYAKEIELVNFRHQRTPGTRPLVRPDTDLVCYSINWRFNVELIRDDINSLPPGISVIVGGRTATEDPRYWLEACPNVKAVVCGDGERAIAEIGEGKPWPEIAGLVHRGDDGQLLFTPPRANAPLDENLMPARRLRSHPYYLTSKGISAGIKLDQVTGSRGCPFHCKFCNFSINPWGVKRHWAPRSPESVVREIEQIDADLVMFVDDVFTYDPERVIAICDLLIARGIHKHYIINARLEIADRPDVLRKMEQAGFLAMLVGVESTQDATLKSMGKGFTIAQVRRRFEVLRKSKMIINAYFIVGNLGETEEQMLSTASFARSLGIDLIHVSRLRNEPYSGIEDLVANTPGYHIDEEGFVYSDALSSHQIAELRKTIDRRFHSPLHVAAVVIKIYRQLNWRVRLKALRSIPPFLAMLVITQANRKLGKWFRRHTNHEKAG
ncbi:MAG: radical SAM protein [Thermoguttaceae bacterium]